MQLVDATIASSQHLPFLFNFHKSLNIQIWDIYTLNLKKTKKQKSSKEILSTIYYFGPPFPWTILSISNCQNE